MPIEPGEGAESGRRGEAAHQSPPWIMLLLIAFTGLLLAACGTEDQEAGTVVETSEAPSATSVTGTETSVASTLPTSQQDEASTVDPSNDQQSPETVSLVAVIVDLAVEWQPEPELESEAAVAEQRKAIRQAQDDVLQHLEGTEFEVSRLYEATPQMALNVDTDALELLRNSDLVTKVSEDIPDPASG